MQSISPARAQDTVVEVCDLRKHYGAVRAVDGITFSVARGEIFGLLGHNGAGKTTTIRVLTGRTRPTSGSVRVAGFDVATQLGEVKPIVNLVFEDQNLYERLTGQDNLKVFADLYGVNGSRIDELLTLTGLESARKRKVKTYSSGMKQRLLIARSLINSPRLLFLDEPTKGLDPTSAREVRAIIRSLARAGTTVVLCTHFMEEADELCDRVAFLANGKIVALDSPRELKLQYGHQTARVLLRDRSEHEIDLTRGDHAQQMRDWMEHGDLLTIHSEEGTLEDVFVALAGRPL
jgi:ABC-2 type transport system ATP-binding protein